jgi:hypothetical protein
VYNQASCPSVSFKSAPQGPLFFPTAEEGMYAFISRGTNDRILISSCSRHNIKAAYGR